LVLTKHISGLLQSAQHARSGVLFVLFVVDNISVCTPVAA
jgi:hypothetical protein